MAHDPQMLDNSKTYQEPWCVDAIRWSFPGCTFAILAPEILDKKSCKDIEFEINHNITNWCDVKTVRPENFKTGNYSISANEINWLCRNIALDDDNDYKSRHWIAFNYVNADCNVSQAQFNNNPAACINQMYTKKFIMVKSSELMKHRYNELITFYYRNKDISRMLNAKSEFTLLKDSEEMAYARSILSNDYDLIPISEVENGKFSSTVVVESDLP